MISRYQTEELKKIWTDENRFRKWFDVEISVLQELEKKKIIPRGTANSIKKKSIISVHRIQEIEKQTKHDVIAFSTSIAERAGDAGKYFHYGLTSSDVVDTGFSLLLVDSLEVIKGELDRTLKILKTLAIKYKKLPCIGRTHGVHAEPMSFGLKFLSFYAELRRQRARLDDVISEIQYGKLSGAVGCYGVLSPEIEKKALQKLNLKVEDVSTQIIPRDRHAFLFSWIAQIGGTIERICVELRHLQRTEVLEVEEGFSKGQKGSSAMPHKKNPISSENLTGCSRLLRGYALSAFENVALWHERDISHSSVERVIAPDATTLLHYMLKRINSIFEDLDVKTDHIERNLFGSYRIFFSGKVLLALVRKGLTREEAYIYVQKAAHLAWSNKQDLFTELKLIEPVKSLLSENELKKLMDVKSFLTHVNSIYARVFKGR